MFVNAINGFNVNRYNAIRSLKDNETQPEQSEEQPVEIKEEEPKKQAYYTDMVNFGSEHNRTKRTLAGLAILTALSGGMTSCQKDEEVHNASAHAYASAYATAHATSYGWVPDTNAHHVIHDTIYIPGDTVYRNGDTIYVPGDTVYRDNYITDTVYVNGDTIYVPGDTVYINSGFESDLFDTIDNAGDDLHVEVDGNGVPVRMTGLNEFDYYFHDLRFKQDFSSRAALTYIDHSFLTSGENIGPNGLPLQYVYRRYDLTKGNGRCYVEVYEPMSGDLHTLPSDAEGKSGWRNVGGFYISNRSLANNPMVITETYDRIMRSKYDKQGVSGYDLNKVVYNNGGSWRTTINGAKIYKADLNSQQARDGMRPRRVTNGGRDVAIDPRTLDAAEGRVKREFQIDEYGKSAK